MFIWFVINKLVIKLKVKKLKVKSEKIINKKGFTLVELLVVISIIAVLTVVTIGSFAGSQKKSRDAAKKANLKSLSDAIGLYYADTGSFPASITFGVEFKKADGTIYMKKTPFQKPGLGINQFQYDVSSTRRSYRLYANLENELDKDCITCPNYSVSTGCCYAITSSNVSLTGDFP